MYASAAPRIASSGRAASAALFVDERDRDVSGLAIPHPEVHLVVRFGPSAEGGLDVHALGGRQTVHRKRLVGGQRVVMARLHLGAAEAVLGAPASTVVGRIVPLEELWGGTTTRRLVDQFGGARDTVAAAAILEGAIAERLAMTRGRHGRIDLVLDAAHRLTSARVKVVADDLDVSERHLRRLFREVVGMGPKTFAKVTRFRRAVRAAREEEHPSWATIAASAGYYDQAHLITEFRAIAGVTPEAFLDEIRAGHTMG